MVNMLDKVNRPPSFLETTLDEHNAELALIPKDHDAVMVTVIDNKGARIGFAARVGESWTISGDLEKRYHQRGVDGRVTFGYSFKRR